MKHNKLSIKFATTVLTVLVILNLFINSCKSGGDDPTPDPITPGTTDEMYIKLNGLKVTCRVPASLYETYIDTKDTAVKWSGNTPPGVGGDTTLNIAHAGPRIKGIKYKVVSFGREPEAVMIYLRWSIVAGRPWVKFDGGDYTLEKVKGKWVSTLKNGTGYDAKDATKRYSNVEFRIIWP